MSDQSTSPPESAPSPPAPTGRPPAAARKASRPATRAEADSASGAAPDTAAPLASQSRHTIPGGTDPYQSGQRIWPD